MVASSLRFAAAAVRVHLLCCNILLGCQGCQARMFRAAFLPEIRASTRWFVVIPLDNWDGRQHSPCWSDVFPKTHVQHRTSVNDAHFNHYIPTSCTLIAFKLGGGRFPLTVVKVRRPESFR